MKLLDPNLPNSWQYLVPIVQENGGKNTGTNPNFFVLKLSK